MQDINRKQIQICLFLRRHDLFAEVEMKRHASNSYSMHLILDISMMFRTYVEPVQG